MPSIALLAVWPDGMLSDDAVAIAVSAKLIGAPDGDNGGTQAGEAYVIFGSVAGFGTIDLGALTAAQGFIIQGDYAGDRAGWSVSSAVTDGRERGRIVNAQSAAPPTTMRARSVRAPNPMSVRRNQRRRHSGRLGGLVASSIRGAITRIL